MGKSTIFFINILMKVFSYYELLRPSTIQMGLQIVAPRTMYQYITRIRMGDFTTRAEEGSIVPTSCRTYTRQQRRVYDERGRKTESFTQAAPNELKLGEGG